MIVVDLTEKKKEIMKLSLRDIVYEHKGDCFVGTVHACGDADGLFYITPHQHVIGLSETAWNWTWEEIKESDMLVSIEKFVDILITLEN